MSHKPLSMLSVPPQGRALPSPAGQNTRTSLPVCQGSWDQMQDFWVPQGTPGETGTHMARRPSQRPLLSQGYPQELEGGKDGNLHLPQEETTDPAGEAVGAAVPETHRNLPQAERTLVPRAPSFPHRAWEQSVTQSTGPGRREDKGMAGGEGDSAPSLNRAPSTSLWSCQRAPSPSGHGLNSEK